MAFALAAALAGKKGDCYVIYLKICRVRSCPALCFVVTHHLTKTQNPTFFFFWHSHPRIQHFNILKLPNTGASTLAWKAVGSNTAMYFLTYWKPEICLPPHMPSLWTKSDLPAPTHVLQGLAQFPPSSISECWEGCNLGSGMLRPAGMGQWQPVVPAPLQWHHVG